MEDGAHPTGPSHCGTGESPHSQHRGTTRHAPSGHLAIAPLHGVIRETLRRALDLLPQLVGLSLLCSVPIAAVVHAEVRAAQSEVPYMEFQEGSLEHEQQVDAHADAALDGLLLAFTALTMLQILMSTVTTRLVLGRVLGPARLGLGPPVNGWRSVIRALPTALALMLLFAGVLAAGRAIAIPGVALVPGLALFSLLCAALPAALAERTSAPDSIRRSWFLTQGHRTPLFAKALLMNVLVAVPAAVAVGLLFTALQSGHPHLLTWSTLIAVGIPQMLWGVFCVVCYLRLLETKGGATSQVLLANVFT